MDKKAFTLIELLIVIVILGIILAMLFPAMGKVREGARRAQCINNLRQHGIAWYLYLDDQDEKFPARGFPVDGKATPGTFGGKTGNLPVAEYGAKYRALNPYIDIDVSKLEDEVEKDPGLEIFHCPSDVKPSEYFPQGTIFDIVHGNSYVANEELFPFSAPQVRLSTITRPRDKVFLERCHEYCYPGHGGKGHGGWPEIPVMVLFVDGHVAGPFLFDEDFERYGGNKVLDFLSGS